MAETMEMPPKEIESEDEDDQTFENLGLDGRLIRALNKKKILKPTPIQRVAIPLILVYFLFQLSHSIFCLRKSNIYC